jgi:hypothetical protein
MNFSTLMALVAWIHFSRPSSSVLDALVEAGAVEKIVDFISASGVTTVTKKKHSGPPSLTPPPSSFSEDEHSCSCDLPEHFVYSEFPFKLALIAMLLLCDRPSFTPDAPLSVSRTHLTVVNQISALAHNSLGSYQVDDPKPLMAISFLFFQLAHQLREMLLPDYEHWVEVAIEGTAHCSSKPVRKYFALTLRSLVPLAPLLLRSLRWKNSELRLRTAASQTSDLVGGVFLSQYPLLSERYLTRCAIPSDPQHSSHPAAVRSREEELRDLVLTLQSPGQAWNQSAELSQLLRPYQIKGETSPRQELLIAP